MNILILTTHLNTGGITSYLINLTEGLIKRGHQVYLASSGGNTENQFREQGVHLISLNIKTKSELDPRIYLALIPLLKIIKENQIDVIHTQTRITQVMGAVLHWLTKVPNISTCHGFFKTRFSRQTFPCWGKAVVAISHPVYEHLVSDFKVPKEKVYLVNNGININLFVPVNEEIKIQKRLEWGFAKEPLLGIIARLSPVKGHDVLIKAMKKVVTHFPAVRLLILGEGPQEKELKDLVASLKLEENIKFYPLVNKTSQVLPLFDLCINPSRQEGLGLSVMEAQACGVPVIASKVGGIPSLIKDGETGLLVYPDHPELLAEAILILLKHPMKAHEMARNARIHIEQQFSADKMLDETLKVYLKVTRV